MKAGGPSNNPPELTLHRLLVCLKPGRWEWRWGSGRVHCGDGWWLQLRANPALSVCAAALLCALFQKKMSLFFKINLNLPPRTRENCGWTETLCQPQAAQHRHMSVVLLDHARSVTPTTFDWQQHSLRFTHLHLCSSLHFNHLWSETRDALELKPHVCMKAKCCHRDDNVSSLRNSVSLNRLKGAGRNSKNTTLKCFRVGTPVNRAEVWSQSLVRAPWCVCVALLTHAVTVAAHSASHYSPEVTTLCTGWLQTLLFTCWKLLISIFWQKGSMQASKWDLVIAVL